MQRNRLINTLLFALLGSLYCWSVLTTIVQFSYLTFHPLALAVLCFTVTCSFLLLSYNKRIFLAGTLTILVLAGAWLILGIRDGRTSALLDDLGYIFRMIVSAEDYNPLYNFQMMFIIALLVSAFVCFSLKTTYNFYLLTGFGIAMFCISLNESKHVGLEFAVLCFVLLTLLLAKLYVRYSRKKKMDGLCLGRYLFRAIPLSLVVVLVASVVSIPFSGIKPAAFFQIETFEKWVDLGVLNASQKSSQFHKGEVNLGGDLNPTDSPVLRVTADHPLYLTGSINDEYTGHSWKQSKTEYNSFPPNMKLVDTSVGLQFYDLLQPEYMKLTNIEITYLTEESVLFIPPKPLVISGIDNNIIFINNAGELETDKKLAQDESYQVLYLDNELMNQGQMQEFSKKLSEVSPDLLSSVPTSSVFNEQTLTTEYSWSSLQQQRYLQNIRSDYTTLPGTVTPRTRDLAMQITEPYEGVAEKAAAIRDYLIQHYTYSLSPGTPDSSQDFVDQFLFDIKKGYCTSFASAMTVLSRCAGIPARYVEGYAMPSQKEEDGSYLVKTRNAHAWAEIYLEKYGWIKIEATPPYAYAQEDGETPQILLDEDEKNPEALQQNLNDLGLESLENDPNKSAEDEMGTEGESDESDTPSSSAANTDTSPLLFAAAGGILVCLLAAAVVLRIFQRRRREIPDGPLDTQLARRSFEQIVKLAKFYGLPMEPGETPLAFGRRLSAQAKGLRIEEAAALYSALQYGGSEMTREEAELIRNSCREFDSFVRLRSKSIRYWFCKYLLHSI